MFKAFRYFAVSIAIALSCVHAGVARADELPKRIALLIGNWDYDLDGVYKESPSPRHVSDLRRPCKDVDMIEAPLRAAGFEIIKRCNLKQGELAAAVNELKVKLQALPKRSVVFVYYAGHGIARHGYTFNIPVAFQWDRDAINRETSDNQIRFFQRNSNDLRDLFAAIPNDFDIGVVVALDSCREDPLTERIGYNEAVSIRIPPNALVQYSTTAGDKVADGGRESKRFASILARELAKDGDIGTIMARVQSQMWNQFASGERDTFAELNFGDAFKALGRTPLRIAGPPPAVLEGVAVKRSNYDVHPESQGDRDKALVRLDFLWCEGPGEASRFALAQDIARKLLERREEFGIGRIRLKPLSIEKNKEVGYRVSRNIMRYDGFYTNRKPIPPELNLERQVLIRIAGAFPDAGFLPKPGIGVRGQPTFNYISAFVCLREDV